MTPEQVEEIRARLAAKTPGRWQALADGNQYLYGDRDHGYLPTASCVAAARVDGLMRVWNPHAVIGFLKFDAAWVSRFQKGDAEFIAHAPQDIERLLSDHARLTKGIDEFRGAVTAILTNERGHTFGIGTDWRPQYDRVLRELAIIGKREPSDAARAVGETGHGN